MPRRGGAEGVGVGGGHPGIRSGLHEKASRMTRERFSFAGSREKPLVGVGSSCGVVGAGDGGPGGLGAGELACGWVGWCGGAE